MSRLCDPYEKQKYAQKFVYCLQFSGHNLKDEISVYKSARKKIDEIVNSDVDGTQEKKPVNSGKYFSGFFIKQTKRINGTMQRSSGELAFRYGNQGDPSGQ